MQVWRSTEEGDWCADLCGGQGSIAMAAVLNWRNAVYVEKDYRQLIYFLRRCTQSFEAEVLAYEQPVWLPTCGLLCDADDAAHHLNNTMTEAECKYFPADWLLAKHEPAVPVFPQGAGLAVADLSRSFGALNKGYRNMESLRVG